MKLELLQRQIREFREFLKTGRGEDHLYKYTMLEQFRKTWTFDTDDFAAMYDRCLQSKVTQRWWKRENYRPKEVMLLLIGAEEQYVRQAFKELLNETKQVENRIDRFLFYCDEILRMYKRKYPRSIENNHYQDSAMISLYLSAVYPEAYALYPGRLLFNRALLALGAAGTGEKDDLSRFFKFSRTVYSYLIKEISVTALSDNHLRPERHMLLAHEFFLFAANAWGDVSPR